MPACAAYPSARVLSCGCEDAESGETFCNFPDIRFSPKLTTVDEANGVVLRAAIRLFGCFIGVGW